VLLPSRQRPPAKVRAFLDFVVESTRAAIARSGSPAPA
jgi:hypothetical protein